MNSFYPVVRLGDSGWIYVYQKTCPPQVRGGKSFGISTQVKQVNGYPPESQLEIKCMLMEGLYFIHTFQNTQFIPKTSLMKCCSSSILTLLSTL